MFSDLELSRRLERAEGFACAQYAEAQDQLAPESGACWRECAGAYAVFNGVDSPITQSFGLGLFEPLNLEGLHRVERFFLDRGAPALHEVSPFAGAEALDLLCERNYRPVEVSNVLYRAVAAPDEPTPTPITVRLIGPEDAELWARTSTRGWAHEHPEMMEFMGEMGAIVASSRQTRCFLAELDGEPGAAGVVCLHQGVALFGGSATVPELRRRGLQSALLRERMRFAFEHGCDLAMMVAAPGSDSQRNAERKGFRIAYTRTKWQLRA
jgi:GNAT superfamily N-acetyltransferase